MASGKTNVCGGDKFVEFDKITLASGETIKLVDDDYIYTLQGIPDGTLRAYNMTTKALAWSQSVNNQSTSVILFSDATHVYVISTTITKVLKTTGAVSATLAGTNSTGYLSHFVANTTHIFGIQFNGTNGVYSVAKSNLTVSASILTPSYSLIPLTCDDSYVYYDTNVFYKKTNILTHVTSGASTVGLIAGRGYGHDSTHIYGSIGGSFCKLNKLTFAKDVVAVPEDNDVLYFMNVIGDYVYSTYGTLNSSPLIKYRKSDLVAVGVSVGGYKQYKSASGKVYYFGTNRVYK